MTTFLIGLAILIVGGFFTVVLPKKCSNWTIGKRPPLKIKTASTTFPWTKRKMH